MQSTVTATKGLSGDGAKHGTVVVVSLELQYISIMGQGVPTPSSHDTYVRTINELIGMINHKDGWSKSRNIVTSHNFDFSKEDTENGMKEYLDAVIQECLEL